MRLIVRDLREGRELDKTCREGFEIARLASVHAQHFAAALQAMDAVPGRALEINGTHCEMLGEGEELVLQVLLLLQHGNEFGARRVLWRYMPPAAARVVLRHLEELALGMVQAGLLLPELPYPLRPCPAEALAARRLGIGPHPELTETFWLN